MLIIGLSGKMGVGKTTIANHLVEKYGFVRKAFGDAVKEEVERKYGVSKRGDKNEIIYVKGIPTTRRILWQAWGMDRREENPMYWDNVMEKYIQTVNGTVDKLIIDDVRFPSEKALIEKYGGHVVRVFPYDGWSQNSDHVSETALDDVRTEEWASMIQPSYGKCEMGADWVVFKFVEMKG